MDLFEQPTIGTTVHRTLQEASDGQAAIVQCALIVV